MTRSNGEELGLSAMTIAVTVVYVTGMLDSLGWQTLAERRTNSRLSMMNKIIGGRVAINKHDHLVESNTRTRSRNSVKLRQLSARTLVYKNSFFPRTIPDWNETRDEQIAEIDEQFD